MARHIPGLHLGLGVGEITPKEPFNGVVHIRTPFNLKNFSL